MKKFKTLREEYKEFIYRGYKMLDNNNCIKLEYYFEIPNLVKFNPTIQIQKSNIKFKDINCDFVRNLVFNIGMIEVISYWKCACPKKIIVECGMLNNEQIEWFKKLYYYGLRRV